MRPAARLREYARLGHCVPRAEGCWPVNLGGCLPKSSPNPPRLTPTGVGGKKELSPRIIDQRHGPMPGRGAHVQHGGSLRCPGQAPEGFLGLFGPASGGNAQPCEAVDFFLPGHIYGPPKLLDCVHISKREKARMANGEGPCRSLFRRAPIYVHGT